MSEHHAVKHLNLNPGPASTPRLRRPIQAQIQSQMRTQSHAPRTPLSSNSNPNPNPFSLDFLGADTQTPPLKQKKPALQFATPPVKSGLETGALTRTAASTTAPAALLDLLPDPQARDSDVFGFGSFADLFITDKELECAKEKLPEDEIKTRDEVLSEIVDTLLQWDVPYTLSELDVEEDVVWRAKGVSLCSNFVVMETGNLHLHSTRISWIGTFPPVSNTPEPTKMQQLVWPRNALIDIRIKMVSVIPDTEEEPLMTMKATKPGTRDLYLQFKFNEPRDAFELSDALDLLTTTAPKTISLSSHIESSLKPENQSKAIELNQVELIKNYEHKKAMLMAQKAEAINRVNEEYRVLMQELEDKLAEELERSQYLEKENGQPITNQDSESSAQTIKECGICCDGMEAYELIPCSHRICGSCYSRLSSSSSWTCPWDRSVVTKTKQLVDQ